VNRKLITTSDGSSTIQIEEWGETYHSIHGAVQEAEHVYIKNGLERLTNNNVKILEMGFGTGLNAFLTALKAKKEQKKIEYHTVEGFPLSTEETERLNYIDLVKTKEGQQIFDALHTSRWNTKTRITQEFTLNKIHGLFEEVNLANDYFDLIYFDVFGYPYQPELWSVEIFKEMYAALKQGGILTTYACRSPIKKAMQNAGLLIEVCSGPPGKREMIIARK
jgi:tRNA U34 5-methylaminomethyl-2-thiouridine-forming methyltransferase MnmC